LKLIDLIINHRIYKEDEFEDLFQRAFQLNNHMPLDKLEAIKQNIKQEMEL